jgi:hypothetical protein
MEITKLMQMQKENKKKSMTMDEALFLYSTIRVAKAQTVLECGTYKGMSTLWAAAALEANEEAAAVFRAHRVAVALEANMPSPALEPAAVFRVYTFDPHLRPFVFTGTKLDRRIRFKQEPFVEGVLDLINTNPPPKPWVVFIDGHSDYDRNRKYWGAILPHLTPNDYVLFHDTKKNRRRGKMVREIEGIINFPAAFGIAVYRHEGD